MGRGFKALLLLAVLITPFSLFSFTEIKGFSFVKIDKGGISIRVKGKRCVKDGGTIKAEGVEVKYGKKVTIKAHKGIFNMDSGSFLFYEGVVRKKGVLMNGSEIRFSGRNLIIKNPDARIYHADRVYKIVAMRAKINGDGERNLVFEGKADLVSEDLRMKGDTICLVFKEEKLKEIKAEGNVKLLVGDKRAYSKKLFWNPSEERLRLEGEAVIKEGDSVFRSDKVDYFVKEGVFKSEGKRIRFFFGGNK